MLILNEIIKNIFGWAIFQNIFTGGFYSVGD